MCGLCRGSGNLFCMHCGDYEWLECPACGGAGVRACFGPPTVSGDRMRFWRSAARDRSQGGEG